MFVETDSIVICHLRSLVGRESAIDQIVQLIEHLGNESGDPGLNPDLVHYIVQFSFLQQFL
jgi:hypothetical protein